jgi:hypothetical protein
MEQRNNELAIETDQNKGAAIGVIEQAHYLEQLQENVD